MDARDRPAFAAGPPPPAPKHPAHPATLVLWAVRTGRIPPGRARHYLAAAGRGEDINILRSLAIPHGAAPVSAHAWDQAVQTVHQALGSIDWSNASTEQATLIERGDGDADASADDWIAMFGPKSPADAERLAARAAARRQRTASMTDAELFAELFERGQGQ